MEKYLKLIKNVFWFGFGDFGSKIANFVLLPIITQYLTGSEYGQYELLNVTIFFAVPIVSLLIFNSLLRFALDKNEDVVEIFSSSFIYTVVSLLIFILLFSSFDSFLPFSDYMPYFYVFLILRVLISLFQNLLKVVDKVTILAVSGVVETISTVVLILVFLMEKNLGLEGYLLAVVVSNFLSFLTIIIFSNPYRYFDFRKVKLSKIKTLLLFSLPLVPNSVSQWFINLSDRYFLEILMDSNAVGMYAVSYKLPLLLTAAYTIFYKAWTIAGIENYSKEDKDNFYSKIYSLLFLTCALLISFSLVILKPLMALFAKSEFVDSWRYTPFLFLSVLFSSLSGMLGVVYLAVKNTKSILITSLLGAFINLVMNYFLIPSFGIQAAAFSTFISFIVVWAIRIIDSKKHINIKTNHFTINLSIALLIIQCVIVIENYDMLIYLNLSIFVLLIFVNAKLLKSNFIDFKNFFEKYGGKS